MRLGSLARVGGWLITFGAGFFFDLEPVSLISLAMCSSAAESFAETQNWQEEENCLAGGLALRINKQFRGKSLRRRLIKVEDYPVTGRIVGN